jgi:hypothetical protein
MEFKDLLQTVAVSGSDRVARDALKGTASRAVACRRLAAIRPEDESANAKCVKNRRRP